LNSVKNDNNNNAELLNTLNDEEKAVVRQILMDVSNQGKSNKLTELYYEDYEEIPVDLETFLCDEQYLGKYTNYGRDIYDTWKGELAYVHNPMNFVDQWAITGSTGTGKAQPLDSLILTPNGYIKMGDVKLNDVVINGKGKETYVTHIYPQGKQPVYRVTFSDRTSVLCAEDHLWEVGERKQRNYQSQIVYDTLTTKQLIDKGLRKNDRWRFRIPTPIIDCWNTVEYLDIDPYLLGILLGDGNLTCDDSVKVALFEEDIKNKVNSILNNEGYCLKQIGSRIGEYRINRVDRIICNQFSDELVGYVHLLEKYNLVGKKSIEKHIPQEYLHTTVANRIKLLQGLFDTDGYVDNRKARSVLQFSTSSPQLSEDFAFLVRSLGGTDTITIKKAGYRKNGKYIQCNDSYEHTIKLPDNILPFSSKKHTDKYVKPQFGPIRRITNIEYVGEQECQCIVVASEDHTYITDNVTVTHNSTVATYSLCYELYKLMCLKDPNRFYLGANETIWILFFNLNLKLAEKTMWGKFQKALQMSPWFLERGTVTGRTNLVYQPNKDIKLGIGSTEEHALSVAVQFVAIDEMSFGDNDNVDYQQAGMMQIYNQLYLRLSSRFMRGGRIQGRMYLISSAKSTNAVLESFIRDNEGQPGMHVSRYKQWEVLPASKFSGKWFKFAVGNELLESRILGILGKDITEEDVKEAEKQGYEVIDVPLEMQHRFEMDMNRTLIDTCGIAVQSSYKYIPFRIVQPCLGTQVNPFKSEIIKTGLKDQYNISDYFIPELVPEILYTKKVYIHCDLSKSGDMTGISAVAVLGYKNQERFNDKGESSTLKEMIFRHIFSVGIKCPANDELSMIKVKDFIHYLKYDLGWNIAGVSCDGYQSLMLLQSLKLDGFVTREVSMDIVKNKEDIGYTVFRNTLVEQRIKIIDLYELTKEITNLEKNETTGKVDHPRQTVKVVNGETIKSVGKDIVDSLGGAVYNATLSVNIDELDYLDSVTIAESGVMIGSRQNVADEIFGIKQNYDGSFALNNPVDENVSLDEQISDAIQNEINSTQNILQKLKSANPNTRLSDKQLKDMYDDFNGDGFIIM
jgi:hypothetical protein